MAKKLAPLGNTVTKQVKKRLGIFGEFKKFIMRGNVIDLAVGVIIGGAFNKIVTSLVGDVIMPLLSVVIGQTNFGTLFIALNGQAYDLITDVPADVPLLKYGNFLSTALDFLIMSFVIFFMMKAINYFQDKLTKEKSEEAPAAPAPAPVPTTKNCPYCISKIHIDATVCPQCTKELKAV